MPHVVSAHCRRSVGALGGNVQPTQCGPIRNSRAGHGMAEGM